MIFFFHEFFYLRSKDDVGKVETDVFVVVGVFLMIAR